MGNNVITDEVFLIKFKEYLNKKENKHNKRKQSMETKNDENVADEKIEDENNVFTSNQKKNKKNPINFRKKEKENIVELDAEDDEEDMIDECFEDDLIQSILVKEIEEKDQNSSLAENRDKRIKRPSSRKKEWIDTLKISMKMEKTEVRKKIKRKRDTSRFESEEAESKDKEDKKVKYE